MNTFRCKDFGGSHAQMFREVDEENSPTFACKKQGAEASGWTTSDNRYIEVRPVHDLGLARWGGLASNLQQGKLVVDGIADSRSPADLDHAPPPPRTPGRRLHRP